MTTKQLSLQHPWKATCSSCSRSHALAGNEDSEDKRRRRNMQGWRFWGSPNGTTRRESFSPRGWRCCKSELLAIKKITIVLLTIWRFDYRNLVAISIVLVFIVVTTQAPTPTSNHHRLSVFPLIDAHLQERCPRETYVTYHSLSCRVMDVYQVIQTIRIPSMISMWCISKKMIVSVTYNLSALVISLITILGYSIFGTRI
jgi:hypothetical protein